MIDDRGSNDVLVTFADQTTTRARLMWMPDGPQGLGQLDAGNGDRARFVQGAGFEIGEGDGVALRRCVVAAWEPLPRGGRSLVLFRRRVATLG